MTPDELADRSKILKMIYTVMQVQANTPLADITRDVTDWPVRVFDLGSGLWYSLINDLRGVDITMSGDDMILPSHYGSITIRRLKTGVLYEQSVPS